MTVTFGDLRQSHTNDHHVRRPIFVDGQPFGDAVYRRLADGRIGVLYESKHAISHEIDAAVHAYRDANLALIQSMLPARKDPPA